VVSWDLDISLTTINWPTHYWYYGDVVVSYWLN